MKSPKELRHLMNGVMLFLVLLAGYSMFFLQSINSYISYFFKIELGVSLSLNGTFLSFVIIWGLIVAIEFSFFSHLVFIGRQFSKRLAAIHFGSLVITSIYYFSILFLLDVQPVIITRSNEFLGNKLIVSYQEFLIFFSIFLIGQILFIINTIKAFNLPKLEISSRYTAFWDKIRKQVIKMQEVLLSRYPFFKFKLIGFIYLILWFLVIGYSYISYEGLPEENERIQNAVFDFLFNTTLTGYFYEYFIGICAFVGVEALLMLGLIFRNRQFKIRLVILHLLSLGIVAADCFYMLDILETRPIIVLITDYLMYMENPNPKVIYVMQFLFYLFIFLAGQIIFIYNLGYTFTRPRLFPNRKIVLEDHLVV